MQLHFLLPAAILAASAPPSISGVTMSPMTGFGGGDGWRAPGEIVIGDIAGTDTAGVYNYLGTGNLERGIAYNKFSGNLILVSRSTAGNGIRLLDSSTGADIGAISQGGVVTGGTFAMSHAGVTSDGAVYVANLTTNVSSSAYKVYKWTAETDAAPTEFFNSTNSDFSPAARLGDDFDLIDGPVIVAGAANTIGYFVIDSTGGTAVTSFAPAGPALGDFRFGITFGPGGGSEVWGRQNTLVSGRRTTYSGGAGTYLGSLPLTTAGEGAMDYALINGTPLLAVLDMNTGGGPTARPMVRIYDVTTASAPSLATSGTTAAGTLAANSNAAGSIRWGSINGGSATLYAMSTNQGVQAFNVTVTTDIAPPTIATSPASRSAYDRGQTTFTVSASGSPPFTYQWYRGVDMIPGANGLSHTINPVTAASSGDYVCRVSNAAPGFAESSPATLTVVPSVNTAALTQAWQLPPGSRPWLSASGETERGVDYNPATNRLYVVSRNPSPQIYILDGTTRDDLGQLNVTGVSGGNFVLMFPGIAADGFIYACNLSNTTTGADFKIYQWPNDDPATAPKEVYSGNPINSRIGDSFDVRGAGTGTECLAGSRNTNQFVLFKPAGPNFLPAVITVDGVPNGAFALGVAFGAGNTVWGKDNGGRLVYCNYDAAAGTGALISSYGAADGIPSSANPLGVDTVNHCLAIIEVGNSDNVRLLQYTDTAEPVLTLLDQEFFSTDNANGNAVGSVYIGGGKVYALDANNGLVCYSTLKPAAPVLGPIVRNSGAGTFSFDVTGTPGFNYVVEASPDLTAASWTAVVTIPFDTSTESVTRPLDANRQFHRVRLGP